MRLFRGLFKILAALVGLPLTLGGFFGFWVGVYIAVQQDPGPGVLIAVGSVLALFLGTILGKFARGDYDGDASHRVDR